ncbi:MAG: hypothetical protein ABIJ39_00580 [Chloroflexota bacterium]
MKNTTFMYIGAVILIIISICGIVGGGIVLLGASDATAGQAEWIPLGIAFMCVGVLMVAGGITLIALAVRKQKQETVQNVTLKVDLPGETRIEQVKCQSCGGTLTADNIKLVNGAPMVNCPFCQTVYQLTEEPKW